MSHEPEPRDIQFAEDLGTWFERLGSTRMVGRVWGCLLTAEEELLSAAEIGRRVGASAGSISSATRDLIAFGIVERRRVPGDRKDYFAIRDGSYLELVRRRFQAITETARLGERGLHEFADRPAAVVRFQEMHDFYDWLAPRFQEILEEWVARQRDEET
jgi:predicted transcriptional regulator